MSQAAPPVLTVRYQSFTRTFAAGHDVVIGRDLRADVRVGHPLISRAHIVVRFDQGRWKAIDNGSFNGMFVNSRRVPVLDIQDGHQINVGNPDGPALIFEVGRYRGAVGRPPESGSMPLGDLKRALAADEAASRTGLAQFQPRSSAPIAPPPTGPPPTGPPPTGPPPAGMHPTYKPGPHQVGQTGQRRIGQTGSGRIDQSGARPIDQSGARPIDQSGGRRIAQSGARPIDQSGARRIDQSGSRPLPRNTAPPSPPQIHRPPVSAPPPNRHAPPADGPNIATSMMKILRPGKGVESTPGALTIGRANDNDIVISEILASRHHATLIPTPSGTQIRDNNSANGTFVRGTRVESALLREGDVVTIGNIDLVFAHGTLTRRDETAADTRTGGLEVRGVTWTIDSNKMLLDNISLSARPGTLTAVIGPSGAGKSTFARLVAGYTQPTSGKVAFEGHNIHTEYASLRSRIGMVPQDDVVHGQLTVSKALGYAAELRLPPDTSKSDRSQVVNQVLEELEMTKHRETRVDRLSGGQRKRASVALELLTGPSLLILDEPTSGLDPALDRQVMTMLRQLADAGRVVLVVTHSLTYLDVCDQVLLLAPGGKTAFCGAPSQIGRAMGTSNWADIFSSVAGNPEAAEARHLARTGPAPPAPPREKPAQLGKPAHSSMVRQFSTVARRQLRLIVSDRGYFVFLALLPFIMGALSMSVPGVTGFGVPDQLGENPDEPEQILVLLNVGAVFMGTALTIRDLIGERPIFKREQAVGLSTSAYLQAKVCVYTVLALIQSAIVTLIALVGKGGPTRGAAALGHPPLELFFDVAGTCVASAMLGLALSSIAKSNEQIMPLLVVAVMSQLVFSGGMIPVTARVGLDQMSWVTPARWGFAASASTVDLNVLEPVRQIPDDSHWRHNSTTWWSDVGMLVLISMCYLALVRWRIRLKGG